MVGRFGRLLAAWAPTRAARWRRSPQFFASSVKPGRPALLRLEVPRIRCLDYLSCLAFLATNRDRPRSIMGWRRRVR